MKKRILAIFAALTVLAVTAVVASAESTTVTVTGGSLSMTSGNVTLSAITLDGTDQMATSAFGDNAWTAKDASGAGVGWNVTIVSTDFVSTGRTINISAADQKFQIQEAHISVIAGSAVPTSSVLSLTNIPETGSLKIVSAAADGTGMGEYNIPPNFSLMVPAETYVASGTYTATITIAVNSGP